MPAIKVCCQCGGTFKVPPRRAEAVKFCSLGCKTEAGYARFNCAACGVEFKRKKSDNANSAARYCSRKCYDSGGKRVNVRAAKPDAPRYYGNCEVCAGVFRVTLTRKDTARWCSKACQSASQAFKQECSTRQLGEKHWRWAGGVYKDHEGYVHARSLAGGDRVLNHRVVVTLAMVEAEPNHPFLVSADGVTKLSSSIEVHHIDRNRANNELSNLLAVTKEAHARIHHRNRKPKPDECWPSDPVSW